MALCIGVCGPLTICFYCVVVGLNHTPSQGLIPYLDMQYTCILSNIFGIITEKRDLTKYVFSRFQFFVVDILEV